MGYLFPGLLLIIILVYVYNDDFDISNIFRLKTLMKAVGTGESTFDFDKSMIIIILGYIAGHFVSYASSLTIEYLANNIYGYPSEYLLHGRKITWWAMLKKYFSCSANSSVKITWYIKIFFKVIIKGLLLLFLLPISITIFVTGWLVDINSYITRPIDDYLKTSILKKQYELAKKLDVKYADVNTKCDYHRLVMHYVYINIPACQRKVDNYISLYGFLRAITFVFCVCFDFCLCYALKSLNIHTSLNYVLLLEIIMLYSMCVLSFLGFVKFYRRQTLENYMTLVVGLKNDNK